MRRVLAIAALLAAHAVAVPAPAAAAACDTYAAPDPSRPRLSLRFAVDGSRVVHGRETVVLRADRALDALVFRLVPNGPRSAAAGGSLRVTSVLVDGVARRPSASSDPTLLRVPVPRIAAGATVTAYLAFVLTLPAGADERLGARGATRWWGSGFPLLALVPGGLADAPQAALGEVVGSVAMDLRSLGVTAPTGLTVVSNAVPGARRASGTSTTWWASAPSVRDVLVAVGRWRHATVAVGRVPVVAVVAPEVRDDPAAVARRAAAGLAAHAQRFGTYPYARLVVPVVPDLRGGVEYPGAYLVGAGEDDATPSHEVAHQWFYGLVGNDQGRHPWLDEALATYADALHRRTEARYRQTPVPAAGRGRAGAPMTYWSQHPDAYFRSVYVQGAVALLRGREREGAERFDAAVRCWVSGQAHRVATPASFEAALADLPLALEELRRVGALPR